MQQQQYKQPLETTALLFLTPLNIRLTITLMFGAANSRVLSHIY